MTEDSKDGQETSDGSREKNSGELSYQQRLLMLHGGTEPPFSGVYTDHWESGTYGCAACGAALFPSDSKFESTTPGLIGWPAFWELANEDAVELQEDRSFGMIRTEVRCRSCGVHLGHYFDDPAAPNGRHYCVNSACLRFRPQD